MSRRLGLLEIVQEIAADDDGFDRMLSDLGVTSGELVAAGNHALKRSLATVAFSGESLKIGTLACSMFVQGAIAGIAFARRRENVEWLADA